MQGKQVIIRTLDVGGDKEIKYLKMEKEGASFEELEHLTLGSLRKAVIDGDVVNGSLMAGQSAGMVKKEESCKEIIEDVVTQAESLLGR